MNRLLIIAFVLCIGTGSMIFAQEVKTNQPTPVVKQQDADNQMEITAVDNRIKVTNAPVGSKLEIFSLVGIPVKIIEIKETSGEYVLNITKGIYIVRIGETVRKLVIR